CIRTRSSSNLPGESPHNPSSFNPKRRNRRRSQQPFILEESPVDTMADQHTMAELLRAPTEGYAGAIVVPSILAEQFELKHRAARQWLEKEPLRSILTWEDLVSKFINEFFPPSRMTILSHEISNFQQRFDESFHEAWDRYKDLLRACPHHGFTELHQLDTFYNALNPADQDSLNSAAGGNLDANSSSSSEIAKLTHAVNQQTSDVTTAMTAILKQFQATPPPASVKAIEEICVTCGGAHPYYQCLTADGNTFSGLQDNIQGYVSAAAVNYN
nr:reverse transcriptase domain-containing protein [Tanacetum cinerariifolium]